MNYQGKTCPHCRTTLQQKQGAFELVRKGTASTQSSQALPVSLYSCPQCGYIELYNLQVTAHL